MQEFIINCFNNNPGLTTGIFVGLGIVLSMIIVIIRNKIKRIFK